MHMNSLWSWYSHTTPFVQINRNKRNGVINRLIFHLNKVPFQYKLLPLWTLGQQAFINTRLSSGRPRWSVFSRNTQQLFAVYSKPATQRRIGVTQSRYQFSPRAASSCSHWHPEWVIQLPLRSLTFLWRGEHEINKWKLIILNTFT